MTCANLVKLEKLRVEIGQLSLGQLPFSIY